MNHCCSGLIETSPAKPATVKTKKAKGISQYLLRFWLLLVRTATVRNRAAIANRKASSKMPVGINETLARYAKPAAKQKTTSTKREMRLVDSLVAITLLVIRPLLLYRRHLGGPNKLAQELARHLAAPAQGVTAATIRSHCSRRPSRTPPAD